jgi:hypothetical protein
MPSAWFIREYKPLQPTGIYTDWIPGHPCITRNDNTAGIRKCHSSRNMLLACTWRNPGPDSIIYMINRHHRFISFVAPPCSL